MEQSIPVPTMSQRLLSGTFGLLTLVLLGMVSAQFLEGQRAEAQTNERTVVHVSLQGSDSNEGTQEAPFLTLQRAVDVVTGTKAEIRIAAGEYNLGDAILVVLGDINLKGGYDPDTWVRDPIITQSVLLPNGFTDTLEDDITDRYKDLRRPAGEKKYQETVIRRVWNSVDDRFVLAFDDSIALPPPDRSTPETVIDGLTILGSNVVAGTQPSLIRIGRLNLRTFQNNMFLAGYSFSRSRLIGDLQGGFKRTPSGEYIRVAPALFKNNLVRGGIVTNANHPRPQITPYKETWMDFKENLILGSTGGSYTRIANLWGAGGTWEENQILGGDSFGKTQLQIRAFDITVNIDAASPVDNLLRNNLIEVDQLGGSIKTYSAAFRDNDITVINRGFATGNNFQAGELLVSRNFTFAGNTLHIPPDVNETNFWPTGARMTYHLGGTWTYTPSEGFADQLTQPLDGPAPTIENNIYMQEAGLHRHKWNLIDLAELQQAINQAGEEAVIRPESPPTNLIAAQEPDGIHLSWTPSADPDVIGYVVRYGDHPGSYLHPILVNGTSTVLTLNPGTHYVTVSAYKAGKVEGWEISNEVEVVVSGEPPLNAAPSVAAGPDQTITLPDSANLDGTVTDDGLPNPPASVTTTWSTVSGPGTVTFGDAALADTTASFSAEGTYVLRLTGDDSALSASDDVQVTVQPPPAPSLTITKPTAGGTYSLSSPLDLEFTGQAPDGACLRLSLDGSALLADSLTDLVLEGVSLCAVSGEGAGGGEGGGGAGEGEGAGEEGGPPPPPHQ